MSSLPPQSTESRAEQFLEAIREDNGAVAGRLLDAHPSLGRFSIFTAAAAGHADAVADLIREDPSRAVARHGQEEWPPLAYACRSRVHEMGAQRANDVRRVAAMLMDAGASANSFSVWFGAADAKMPNPVLYHACMSGHVALVTLLLERGANPNDGESIYHAAQFNRRACLDALRAHGGDLSSRQQPYGNTPLYFLVGHHDDRNGNADWFKGFAWLLEHGADPNVTSYASGETPLHGVAASAPKLATVRQLLAHGADVNLPRRDGRTPYAIAVRHGNAAVADLLREHGARTDVLQPVETFLGACFAADGEGARGLLAAHPGLFESMTDEDRSAMADAVRQNNGNAIRLMVDLGFQLSWQEAGGGTPLHVASWLGNLEIARRLIALGAPINVRDTHYGSSPLGWAAHGSGCRRGNDDAYCAIVDALIDAGADRDTSVNTSGTPPEEMASECVSRHLKGKVFA